MAKSANQKPKLLYLMKILKEETDDDHGLTLQDIIDRLEGYGIRAERKALYQDFEELQRFGLDIIKEQVGRSTEYHLGAREFELAELKLLVDAVQASRFITNRKSNDLIRKLEGLTSRHQGNQLQRQVLISGRVKTMNESIFINVDRLHDAINANCQIRFKYYQWNVRKEPELRRGGSWYQVSPWALTWDDHYYYLIGYDAAEDKIKHYRVDKMKKLEVTKEARAGVKRLSKLDMAEYTKGIFGMFGGEKTSVVMEAENSLVGVIIDRFGQDVQLAMMDDNHFEVRVDVAVSENFLGWVIGLGSGIKITSPHSVIIRMQDEIRRLSAQYPEGD